MVVEVDQAPLDYHRTFHHPVALLVLSHPSPLPRINGYCPSSTSVLPPTYPTFASDRHEPFHVKGDSEIGLGDGEGGVWRGFRDGVRVLAESEEERKKRHEREQEAGERAVERAYTSREERRRGVESNFGKAKRLSRFIAKTLVGKALRAGRDSDDSDEDNDEQQSLPPSDSNTVLTSLGPLSVVPSFFPSNQGAGVNRGLMLRVGGVAVPFHDLDPGSHDGRMVGITFGLGKNGTQGAGLWWRKDEPSHLGLDLRKSGVYNLWLKGASVSEILRLQHLLCGGSNTPSAMPAPHPPISDPIGTPPETPTRDSLYGHRDPLPPHTILSPPPTPSNLPPVERKPKRHHEMHHHHGRPRTNNQSYRNSLCVLDEYTGEIVGIVERDIRQGTPITERPRPISYPNLPHHTKASASNWANRRKEALDEEHMTLPDVPVPIRGAKSRPVRRHHGEHDRDPDSPSSSPSGRRDEHTEREHEEGRRLAAQVDRIIRGIHPDPETDEEEDPKKLISELDSEDEDEKNLLVGEDAGESPKTRDVGFLELARETGLKIHPSMLSDSVRSSLARSQGKKRPDSKRVDEDLKILDQRMGLSRDDEPGDQVANHGSERSESTIRTMRTATDVHLGEADGRESEHRVRTDEDGKVWLASSRTASSWSALSLYTAPEAGESEAEAEEDIVIWDDPTSDGGSANGALLPDEPVQTTLREVTNRQGVSRIRSATRDPLLNPIQVTKDRPVSSSSSSLLSSWTPNVVSGGVLLEFLSSDEAGDKKKSGTQRRGTQRRSRIINLTDEQTKNITSRAGICGGGDGGESNGEIVPLTLNGVSFWRFLGSGWGFGEWLWRSVGIGSSASASAGGGWTGAGLAWLWGSQPNSSSSSATESKETPTGTESRDCGQTTVQPRQRARESSRLSVVFFDDEGVGKRVYTRA